MNTQPHQEYLLVWGTKDSGFHSRTTTGFPIQRTCASGRLTHQHELWVYVFSAGCYRRTWRSRVCIGMVYGVRGGFAYGDPSLIWQKKKKEKWQDYPLHVFPHYPFPGIPVLRCSRSLCSFPRVMLTQNNNKNDKSGCTCSKGRKRSRAFLDCETWQWERSQ